MSVELQATLLLNTFPVVPHQPIYVRAFHLWLIHTQTYQLWALLAY